MVGDLVPATHSKFVLVFAVTVSPVCIQLFVTEREPFCDRVTFYFGFGDEQRPCKVTIIKVCS